MSIRVFADGADGFALLSPRGELVGWIRGRAIGVAGFDDESAAIEAAIRANRVLSEWLERNGLSSLAEFGDSNPHVVCSLVRDCRPRSDQRRPRSPRRTHRAAGGARRYRRESHPMATRTN